MTRGREYRKYNVYLESDKLGAGVFKEEGIFNPIEYVIPIVLAPGVEFASWAIRGQYFDGQTRVGVMSPTILVAVRVSPGQKQAEVALAQAA